MNTPLYAANTCAPDCSGSTGSSAAPLRRLGPGGVPAPGSVPLFAPLRVPGGRLRRGGRPARAAPRVLAAALTAVAVAALAPGPATSASPAASSASSDPGGGGGAGGAPQGGPPPGGERVEAPVRLADPAVAALLRRGDLVDVVAAGPRGRPRVLARGVRVVRLPGPTGAGPGDLDTGGAGGGALVVLSAPLPAAVRLLGTAPDDRLTVAFRGGR
ncbi:hypothetical protein [Streptomyces fragilis]|uniref:Flp pilus assembly protein RcpC/CpaB domain-containing protein n=1 Tax=Streptomyces fragilis TaxID=67301 RepID=A0ABV2YCJ3_9ACTN|nr:hypothetical protein [Streptomyces fragilis]